MNEQKELGKEIRKYAIPAIISGVLAALYNIIDQVFIGHIVGTAGNAATNIAFPLVTLITSIMLMIGIGGTANFCISLGRKDMESAKKYVGVVALVPPIAGVIITAITLIFLNPLLRLFGATETNFALSSAYVSITAFGFPLWMTTEAFTKVIRADGAPRYAMVCSITGAILNCILNPIFMVGFGMGIQGAALATVVSQLVSFVLTISYIPRFKHFKIVLKEIMPPATYIQRTAMLGSSQFANQIVMMITQIIMNNVYVHYGALSVYGADIPLACVGIITKINSIYLAIMIGLAQGAQPLLGFNFGAGEYGKIRSIYLLVVKYASVIAIACFGLFQLFPREILSIFGADGDLFFEFGVSYFRIYMLFAFLNGVNPITFTFFTAIGKPIKSMIVSLSKQLVFMIPLVLLLPRFYGLTGVLYAGPVADVAAFILSITFVSREMKILGKVNS